MCIRDRPKRLYYEWTAGAEMDPADVETQIRRAMEEAGTVKMCIRDSYTVGPGVSPGQRARARGLYRQSGISPCPEDIILFS